MHILIKSSELPPLQIVIHITCILYMQELRARQVSYLFRVIQIVLFIWFMGFSRQEYWSGLPFHSPVDHTLSEPSTMTHLFRVALHGMAHSFIELDKAVVHVISLVSFLWLWFCDSDCDCDFHSVCPLMEKNKRLMEVSWWERLTEREIGSCSDGQGHAQ